MARVLARRGEGNGVNDQHIPASAEVQAEQAERRREFWEDVDRMLLGHSIAVRHLLRSAPSHEDVTALLEIVQSIALLRVDAKTRGR
jgi:hypothetical protein